MLTTNRRLIFVSACMLGVYLIHPLFIKLFYGLKLSLLTPHPIVVVPVVAIAIFALSLLVTSIFRPIALFKKFF